MRLCSWIDLAAGVVYYLVVGFKGWFGYDDSLDVVGVHMVGGILGVLLTGVFASLVINSAGAAASFARLGKQAVLAGVKVAFSFAATMLILKVTDATVGLRLTEEHEEAGLDSSQHRGGRKTPTVRSTQAAASTSTRFEAALRARG
jgi:ammonium transporter, Amt family